MIDSHIKPALIEGMRSSCMYLLLKVSFSLFSLPLLFNQAHSHDLALIESLSSSFLRHASRLAVVKEEKRRKQLAVLGRFCSKS